MRYLSVCSGIEAATVAWHPLGWQPVGFSEIEAFPSAVLAHHYPDVRNYGDMTQYKEWDIEHGSVDLLVGGTPCQSFSVAGLRRGLEDPRGNLALTYVGILDRLRPEWFVWENVPGVLSSNGGRDFGSFLGALAELGYGFAYRVLDAQYFGVAQRRRRVFVVGYLGDWRPAAEVLFERESVRGNPAPSREKGKEVAGTIEASLGRSRGAGTPSAAITQQPVAMSSGQAGAEIRIDGGAPTLTCLHEAPITAYALADVSSRDKNQNGAGWKADGTMYTLDTTGLQGVAQPMTQYGSVAGSLTARHDSSPCADRGQNVVAQPIAFGVAEQPDVGHCLRSGASKADKHESTTYISQSMAVRRLTPVECERLQGFPDNYTNIPWRKQPESPDGPRYKALGNSMAVPVMRWIGERIQLVMPKPAG